MGPAEVGRAVAEVDLSAIADNIATLRRAAPAAAFMAVVKADGYGHGMVPVARAARAAGAEWLGVALPAEAVALRASGDTGPLLAWLYSPGDDLEACVAVGVDLSAAAPWALEAIAQAGRNTATVPRVHLKVDTGLGRNGSPIAAWPELLRAAAKAQDRGVVDVVGVWSHLACSDEPDSDVTASQVGVFEDALDMMGHVGLRPRWRHLANSAATMIWPNTHYDLVRCGIAVYGLAPGPAMGNSASLGLRPAMRVSAGLALVKDVPAGQGVSYGLRYTTTDATRLALVPTGYADGVPRNGSGRLPVRLAGQDLTAAGTIAMDQFVLDVGDLDVGVGQEVVLFGDGEDGPTAQDWAEACGTINYEIITRLGTRIPRRYREE